MKTMRAVWMALVMAGSGVVASEARAETCLVDGDCREGQVCEEVQVGVACPPPIEGEEAAPCPPPQTSFACVAAPPQRCDPQASGACGAGLVCHTFEGEECSGGGAPCVCVGDGEGEPDCACEEPEPEQCTVSSESFCVPPYLLECEADADCGSGFTCVERDTCVTSCPASPDGAGPSECDTSCSGDTVRMCDLVEQACEVDADCAQGFFCYEAERHDVLPCALGEDCATVDEPEVQRYCAPSGWETWGEVGIGHGSIGSGSDDSGSGQGPGTPSRGEESGATSGAQGDLGGGGCQAAGAAQAGSALWMLAGFAGLMGWRRRRS